MVFFKLFQLQLQNRFALKSICAMALLGAMSSGVQAAATIFIKPTTVAVQGLGADYSLESPEIFDRTINGNGLSNANLVVTGASYLNTTTQGPSHNYAFSPNTGRYTTLLNQPNVQGQGTSKTANLNMVFDLGSAFAVEGMWLWNYMEGGGDTLDRRNRGFDSISVEFSTDGVNWNQKQTVTPSLARTDGFAEELRFAGIYENTRYIRFSEFSTFGTVMSDIGGTGPGANRYAGMSELRFIGNVPEPTPSMLCALAGIAFSLRRSRKR